MDGFFHPVIVIRSRALLDEMVEPDVCNGKAQTVMLALKEVRDVAVLPALIYKLRALQVCLVYRHGRLCRTRPEGALELRVEKVAELEVQKHVFLRVYHDKDYHHNDNAREKQPCEKPQIVLYKSNRRACRDEDKAYYLANALKRLIAAELF